MANTKIPSELVAINAISGTLIADNAITSVHIAENNITAVQIAINAVTALQMADGTITSAKIADGTIVTADIADGQITTGKLADSSVTTGKIAAGTIVSSDIANNAILTQHIDDNQITADQIADNAVGVDQLAGITRGSVLTGNAAGNPSLLALGAANTLLQSDGTDLVFAPLQSGIDDNSNAVAITIDSSENVGIGTGTPSSKLHVKHGDIRLEGNAESGQDITFTITNDNSGNEVEAGLIRFIDTGGGQSNRGAAIASYMPTADTGDLRFYTSAGADRAERMRISSAGKVGIGEISPDGLLHLKGATATGDASHILFENTQGSKVFAIGGGSTGVTNSHLYFRNVTDNTRPMVITDAGPIGIGTDAPYSGSKLTVQTDQSDAYSATGFNSGSLLRIVSVNANTNYSSIAFSNVGGNYEHFIGAVQTSANTADIVFQGYDRAASAYKEYLRITDGGNVGIGIPAAAAKLDVSAPATDRETIRLSTYYSPVDSLARGGITWHDGANITGQIDTRYDGSTVDMHIGSLYSGGYNTSTKMIVKGNGAVQTPLQPSCNVYHNTASMSIAAGSKFIFNVVGHNVANLYDTTTGRITAPVAGTYLLTFNTIFQGSYSNAYFQFYLNNARSYVLGDYHLSANPSASAHWQTHQYSKVVYLAKTDYIEVFARTAMTWHGTHWGGLSCHLL